jgi:ABC-type uncharacterized transport system involved in gliding motility auxiliary subunit
MRIVCTVSRMADPLRRRLWLKWQGYLSALLILAIGALAGYLSLRYERIYDWTAARRHTISEATQTVLAGLDQPVTVSAYMAKASPLREQARFLLERYQRVKPDMVLEFVDPDLDPDRVRKAGVRFDGEMVVRYGEREQHVDGVSEDSLTNALQSLARGGERWLAFVQGHGERDPQGKANHDLGLFGTQLSNRGFRVQPLVLAQTAAVPDNTALLVIASPQSDWLDAEVSVVRDYLQRGGNLLLLTEPGPPRGLGSLLTELGVGTRPGTIVDPTSQKLGLDNAALTLIAEYPAHPATAGFKILTLFPYAAALQLQPADGWEHAALLETADGAWAETDAMSGNVAFDDGADAPGPLTVGVAMTRPGKGAAGSSQQRVAVIGDGDFLSNTYLGNSGNLDLGMRLFTWLTGDDRLIAIPARTAPDATLELSRPATLFIGFGFLFALPLALLAAGARIWYVRRRR